MNEAKIEDLAINPTAQLTPMVKKNLVTVIESEFDRQATIYDSVADEKKEKILESYKKSVGFSKLKAEYDKYNDEVYKATQKRDEIQTKIRMKGLDIDGTRYRVGYYSNTNSEQREIKRACDKIDNLFKTVEANGPLNVKNKIVSRLWLADTAGEAMVILREVLGNGIIPTLTKNQLQIPVQE